jgi:exosortase/archaeosortase family protein
MLEITNGLEQQFSQLLAQLSAVIIHLFDNSVTLEQAVLRHGTHGFAIEVTSACNALNLTWLSITAFALVPTNWKMRILGVVAILFIIQTANIARLIILLYVGEMVTIETFNFIHDNLFVLILHLFVIIIFFMWLQWLSQHKKLYYEKLPA